MLVPKKLVLLIRWISLDIDLKFYRKKIIEIMVANGPTLEWS